MLRAIFFEDHIHCVNDLLARVFFAVNDDFVLQRLRTINLHLVVLSEAIIPAAIPNRQIISVLLKRIGELFTRQCLNVDVAVLVRIGGKLGSRHR